MGEHELFFDAKEMRIVEVVCPICGAGVVFDAGNEQQKVPSRCPSCAADDPEMYAWLGQYRKWYQAILPSQKKFRFRVPVKS